MKRKQKEHPWAPALTPDARALAELERTARLRPVLLPLMIEDEKRRRARRAELLAVPKGKRTAAEERALDSMAVGYLMQLAGVFGSDQKCLAETKDCDL